MILWSKLKASDLEKIASKNGVRAEINSEDLITRGKNKGRLKIQFKLFPLSDKYRKISLHGLAFGQKERRVNAVCYHGHYFVMQDIFLSDSKAHLKTAMANYDSVEGFLDNFLQVGQSNVGSMMYPVQYRESCNCFSQGLDMIDTKPLEDITHEVEFSEISPQGGVTTVRTLKQSSMKACPHSIMMPEHYREDESCRCDDPTHTEMSDYGYSWDSNFKRWV